MSHVLRVTWLAVFSVTACTRFRRFDTYEPFISGIYQLNSPPPDPSQPWIAETETDKI